MKLINFIKKFNQEESGQDLVEYALVLVAVAGAATAGSNTIAGILSSAMGSLSGKITTAMGAA